MLFKNHDNFTDVKSYIINHLSIYDYNNPEHFQKIKMKIWVLDGPISDDDKINNYIDDDYNNPKNHMELLANELNFLDRYVRTQDNLLVENEIDFEKLKKSRISQYQSFIKKINPETGQPFHDYEMPYNTRPTYLSDLDFQDLYLIVKQKQQTNEINTAFGLVTKLTTYCIDNEIVQQEELIKQTKTPAELEEIMKDAGTANAIKNDIHYVNEMKRCHDEIFNIIKSIEPNLPPNPYPATIPDPSWDGITQPQPDPIPNPDKRENEQIIIVNFPQWRDQVSLTDTSTHRGNVIGLDPITMKPGGYRFVFKSTTGENINIDTTNIIYSVGTNQILNGELENNFDNWFYAHYYEDTVGGVSSKHINFICDKSSISSIPNSEQLVGSLSIERFNELNHRWINLNNLREYQIAKAGSRIFVEALISGIAPDLKPDMLAHLEDKKTQKIFYTKTLQELCPEFI